MAKTLKVLLEGCDHITHLLGDDPWEFDLPAYFMKCISHERDALYIPKLLVAVEAFEKEENYFIADNPKYLMNEEEFDPTGLNYLEDADYNINRELVLPRSIENIFDGKKFDFYYTTLAVQLLMQVRKGIRKGV